MNGVTPRVRQRGSRDLAIELCELFREQFEALQRGLAEDELEQYLERRGRIHQLQIELKALVPRPS